MSVALELKFDIETTAKTPWLIPGEFVEAETAQLLRNDDFRLPRTSVRQKTVVQRNDQVLLSYASIAATRI